MKSFTLINPTTLDGALEALVQAMDRRGRSKAALLAGGQDLLTELKEHLAEPEKVVNLKNVPGLATIQVDGTLLRIGALASIEAIESHPIIRERAPALAEAAATIASPQIRSVGTIGGNLCQRPRCWYYRLEEAKCIKKGGAECFSYSGRNKYNAIFGGGPSYIVHPSDMATALTTLDAQVVILSPKGTQTLPIERFFTLPSEGSVLKETVLKPDEIVVEVQVPLDALSQHSAWSKFKERASYDWALSSVCVAVVKDGSTVKRARVTLGGVAPIPWRVPAVEALLVGKSLDEATIAAASEEALRGAEPLSENGYKIPLTKGLLTRVLRSLA